MVLIYDDFRDDNEATLRRVLRFLDVDDTYPIEPIEANPTVRVRSPRVHQAIHAITVGGGAAAQTVRGGVKLVTPSWARRGLLGLARHFLVDSDISVPDEAHMGELRRRFKPEIVALSKYLDRDLLTLWGYNDVG
jgi:hypothetical protein